MANLFAASDCWTPAPPQQGTAFNLAIAVAHISTCLSRPSFACITPELRSSACSSATHAAARGPFVGTQGSVRPRLCRPASQRQQFLGTGPQYSDTAIRALQFSEMTIHHPQYIIRQTQIH
jgi:hypothetical protein